MTRLVAYAWHPLPLWEIANNGHVDALMVALMMLGIWLAVSGYPLRGAVAVALGALAKPLAALALPSIWRAWDWKLPLLVLIVVALCYAPYLSVGAGALGFLTEYVTEEKFDTGGFVWPLAAVRLVAGAFRGDVVAYASVSLLILAAMAVLAGQREPRTADAVLADTSRLILAALFLISPNYPWYVLIATPFVALCGGAPVWAMTIGAILLHEEVLLDPFVPLLWRKSVLYGAFLLACAYTIWRAWHGTRTNEGHRT